MVGTGAGVGRKDRCAGKLWAQDSIQGNAWPAGGPHRVGTGSHINMWRAVQVKSCSDFSVQQSYKGDNAVQSFGRISAGDWGHCST